MSGFFRWSGKLPERVLPNGQVDLVFSLDDAPIDSNELYVSSHVRAVLYGGLRYPLSGFGGGTVDLFGISLFPWASEAVSGLSASELDGRILPFRKIGGIEADPLRAMLSECSGDMERIRLMEEVFALVLPEPGEVELALHRHWVATWRNGGHSEDVEDLAISGRSRRFFQKKMGMTVRQFARLSRFHAFLRRLDGGEKISTLAQDTGYYDQAHLTRECRDFAGIPPRQLHADLVAGARVFRREPMTV